MGLAAAVLARKHGVAVAATTRRPESEQILRENGADHVFIDSGQIADDVRRTFAGGVDRVLELVGTTTLVDSLKAAGRHGVVCMTGMVGDQWEFDDDGLMRCRDMSANDIPIAEHERRLATDAVIG